MQELANQKNFVAHWASKRSVVSYPVLAQAQIIEIEVLGGHRVSPPAANSSSMDRIAASILHHEHLQAAFRRGSAALHMAESYEFQAFVGSSPVSVETGATTDIGRTEWRRFSAVLLDGIR